MFIAFNDSLQMSVYLLRSEQRKRTDTSAELYSRARSETGMGQYTANMHEWGKTKSIPRAGVGHPTGQNKER